MMGDLKKRASFARVVNYVNNPKKARLIDSKDVRQDDNTTIARSMQGQADDKPGRRLKNPVYHISLDFAHEDTPKLTDGLMAEIAREYMKRMGIVNTQYIVCRHTDREHQHLHIVANRVDNDGNTISDSNDNVRNVKVCKALTREYGLHFSKGKVNVKRDRLRGSPFGFLCAARYSGVHSRRYAGRLHHRCRSDRRFRSVVADGHGTWRCSQMKKLLCVLLIALTLVPLAACGGEKDKVTAAADSADNQAPEASVSQKQPSEKKSEPKPAAFEPTQSTDGVDVDLTRLSSTMVYSEVYNMMNAPGDYIGKTIKMTGQFVYYENPDTQAQYFTCIIGDAMACCSQGLEFVLTGKHTYPDDYPELGSEITVSGTFELYEEGDNRYCRLVDAEMIGQ